jgi:hypothetical protein
VEQSLSREAVSAIASQQIAHIVWDLSSSPHLQEPATRPYPKPDKSNKRSHPIFWTSILILDSHLCLGLASGLSPSGLPKIRDALVIIFGIKINK